MQYICRSCFQHLGQRWPSPARLPPWQIHQRATYSLNSLDQGASRPSHHEDPRHSTKPLHTADSARCANGPVEYPSGRYPVSPHIGTSSLPARSQDSGTDPERLPRRDIPHSFSEDWRAVSLDEAFDASSHTEPGASEPEPCKQRNTEQSLPFVAHNSREEEFTFGDDDDNNHRPVRLSRREFNQLSLLRSATKKWKMSRERTRFNAWKFFLSGVTKPETVDTATTEAQDSRAPNHSLMLLEAIRSCKNVEDMEKLLHLDVPTLRESGWKRKSSKGRIRIILYTALRKAPELVPMVLRFLFSHVRLRFYVVEDIIQFLATRLRNLDLEAKQQNAEILADLILDIAKSTERGYSWISQNTVFSIMDSLNPDRLEDWFRNLLTFGPPLHEYTLLQFASRFGKIPQKKCLSHDILRDLCRQGKININTPVGASICTSILAFEEGDLRVLDDNATTPAELLQCLLDLGLIPNVITYTTIIRSLCLKKDLALALEVLEVMKQHRVQPDAHVYSVIINGCKLCNDYASLTRFAVEARALGVLDPIVWNDVIHATFLACLNEPKIYDGSKRPRLIAWGPMKEMYSRFFDSRPLMPLISPQLTDYCTFMEARPYVPVIFSAAFAELPPLNPEEILQPTTSTLGLMAMGLVRHLPTAQEVVIFYSYFRHLLARKHAVAELLVREQGNLIYNIVLRALLKWDGTLSLMLGIVKDMMMENAPLTSSVLQPGEALQAAPNATVNTGLMEGLSDMGSERQEARTFGKKHTAKAKRQRERSPVPHPRPCVRTWSILLKAFMSHGLSEQAQRILGLMRAQGVEPNLVTWNTLAAEYAKLGKIQQSVEAMHQLEVEGFQSDEWTLRAFSYIKDKHRAIRMMNQAVNEKRLKMAAQNMHLQQIRPKMAAKAVQTQESGGDEMRHQDRTHMQEQVDPPQHWCLSDEATRKRQLDRATRQRQLDEGVPVSRLVCPISRTPITSEVKEKVSTVGEPNSDAWDQIPWDHPAGLQDTQEQMSGPQHRRPLEEATSKRQLDEELPVGRSQHVNKPTNKVQRPIGPLVSPVPKKPIMAGLHDGVKEKVSNLGKRKPDAWDQILWDTAAEAQEKEKE